MHSFLLFSSFYFVASTLLLFDIISCSDKKLSKKKPLKPLSDKKSKPSSYVPVDQRKPIFLTRLSQTVPYFLNPQDCTQNIKSLILESESSEDYNLDQMLPCVQYISCKHAVFFIRCLKGAWQYSIIDEKAIQNRALVYYDLKHRSGIMSQALDSEWKIGLLNDDIHDAVSLFIRLQHMKYQEKVIDKKKNDESLKEEGSEFSSSLPLMMTEKGDSMCLGPKNTFLQVSLEKAVVSLHLRTGNQKQPLASLTLASILKDIIGSRLIFNSSSQCFMLQVWNKGVSKRIILTIEEDSGGVKLVNANEKKFKGSTAPSDFVACGPYMAKLKEDKKKITLLDRKGDSNSLSLKNIVSTLTACDSLLMLDTENNELGEFYFVLSDQSNFLIFKRGVRKPAIELDFSSFPEKILSFAIIKKKSKAWLVWIKREDVKQSKIQLMTANLTKFLSSQDLVKSSSSKKTIAIPNSGSNDDDITPLLIIDKVQIIQQDDLESQFISILIEYQQGEKRKSWLETIQLNELG